MTYSAKWRLTAICVVAAFVQGWIVLKSFTFSTLFLFTTLPGAIPFLMLNGLHGDTEGAAGVIGGVLFVLVNAAVYYGITVLILKLIGRRKLPTKTLDSN